MNIWQFILFALIFADIGLTAKNNGKTRQANIYQTFFAYVLFVGLVLLGWGIE